MLVSALHKFVTYLLRHLTHLLTYSPRTHTGRCWACWHSCLS